MRLICTVKVDTSRMHPSGCSSGSQRARASTLSFGRSPGPDKEACLFLQSAIDPKGVKYKVKDNIVNVFARFVQEGKCTIRLKQPAHDLIIQAEPLLLKSFLKVIKLGIAKGSTEPEAKIPILEEKYFRPKIQTKYIVATNTEYPTLQGFPRTVEELRIVDLQRKSFDRQILRLEKLRLLDLSKNCIRSLPAELGSLPNLKELYLGENHLGKSPSRAWAWLNGDSIKRNLVLLDLSRNEMTWLPLFLGQLTALKTLNLSYNMLTSLPGSIGLLSSLRCLSIQENRIQSLPGSIRRLRLENINISGNPFSSMTCLPLNQFKVSTLVECAARSVLKARLNYDAETIPHILVKYLNGARFCDCGGACFENHVYAKFELDLRRISESCIFSTQFCIPLDCFFCSMKCTRFWIRS
ncbi:leucine-rich repeat protein 1 isoform X2 [Athalia rosae]|uniref:leucine-rich repeat protein 1 isoform X2 n=1 Tax=Athalia rosae TaxID=37344 RepID=UPI00203412A6|nr:leucine-rich repeat protein 1 isoform X2 [Athalia rosae]